jgi:hypothetical protein
LSSHPLRAENRPYLGLIIGDSCVLAIARGNKISEIIDRRHHNVKCSAGRFIHLFKQHDLKGHQISIDAGGLGVGFLYDFQEAGYWVKEVHNGSAPNDPEHYASRRAEMWDKLNILIQKRRIILPDDPRLFVELSNRRKEYDPKGRLALEPKASIKARGLSSPDIAGAVILATMSGWGGPSQITESRLTRGLTSGQYQSFTHLGKTSRDGGEPELLFRLLFRPPE